MQKSIMQAARDMRSGSSKPSGPESGAQIPQRPELLVETCLVERLCRLADAPLLTEELLLE